MLTYRPLENWNESLDQYFSSWFYILVARVSREHLTGSCRKIVYITSGKGLLPSGIKPLPEPKWRDQYRHMAALSQNELIIIAKYQNLQHGYSNGSNACQPHILYFISSEYLQPVWSCAWITYFVSIKCLKQVLTHCIICKLKRAIRISGIHELMCTIIVVNCC